MLQKFQFSRTQTMDLRLAMAAALARMLGSLAFDSGGRPFSFARVFDEWPSWEDADVCPAACVLPDEELVYANARLTPTLLEETWEPKGQAGWGLYAQSDAEIDIQINVRAASPGERTSISMVLENAFVESGVTGNYARGSRYGILLPMPEYFGMEARFSLKSRRDLDDADTAAKNWNESIFVVTAQAPQVKVDKVFPFLLRIQEVIE